MTEPSPAGTPVRAVVDRAACIGAQTCLAAAPGAFVIDDEGLAVPTDAEGVDPATLARAVLECPTGAITLVGAGLDGGGSAPDPSPAGGPTG